VVVVCLSRRQQVRERRQGLVDGFAESVRRALVARSEIGDCLLLSRGLGVRLLLLGTYQGAGLEPLTDGDLCLCGNEIRAQDTLIARGDEGIERG
jgi:hypothetical protein